jgi:outer membrane lipopolysaccharide assembly protein LptE/RlpB
MEKEFDDALMDLIDEYLLAAEQAEDGNVEEMREDIISALELRLAALKEENA